MQACKAGCSSAAVLHSRKSRICHTGKCSLLHDPAHAISMQDLQSPFSASGALLGGSCGYHLA